MNDLVSGLNALDAEQKRLEEAWAHYEGTTPEYFASVGVARYLRDSGRRFRINWCRTVVTAVLNRLEIAAVSAVVPEAEDGLPADASPAQVALDACWYDNRLGLGAPNLHESALGYGETYAIVWPDPDDETKVNIDHNPPTQVAIVYDPENGRTKRYAIKRWMAAGERLRVNLYYADRTERYVTREPLKDGASWDSVEFLPYFDLADGEDEEDSTIANPYGIVPVFHFRPQWPIARPEHLDAYGAQNGLNKLVASYFGTVDFQVFPQRYGLTEKAVAASTADEDFQELESEETAEEDRDRPQTGPGTFWWLDNAKSVGQFQPADPKVFWDPIQQLVQHLAVTTETPSHVFQFGGTPPSGESRRAENEPLYAKVAHRQAALGATWEELFEFVLVVRGIGGSVQIDWAPIDRADDKDGLEAAKAKLELGVPRDVVLMEAGYTDREMATWAEQAATMSAGDEPPPDSPPEGDTP